MQQDNEKALLFTIRGWCQQQHWYGPALANARWTAPTDHPQRRGFAAPPATPQQLEQAEYQLGFALPTLLKTLYTTLANGGFGPGYGLRSLDPDERESLVPMYASRVTHRGSAFHPTLHRLREQGIWHPDQPLDLSFRRWPTQLIPICNWGCGGEICLDCSEGSDAAPVLHLGPASHPIHVVVTVYAPSLEAWLSTSWLEQ